MPLGLEAGARGEKRKQWKRTGKSPSAVRSKAYRVTHCCSAALLVLACCWWSVLCGWVGLGRARMEAPADPVSPVMDEFGWKLLVLLWPCWLDACFTGRRCDPLCFSEQGPRTIKQLHSKQIKFFLEKRKTGKRIPDVLRKCWIIGKICSFWIVVFGSDEC